MNSLCLSRSCRFASTDCPYRFVSDNRTFECRSTLSFQYHVDLTCANFFSFSAWFLAFSVSPMRQTGVRPCSFSTANFFAISWSDSCGKYDVQSGQWWYLTPMSFSIAAEVSPVNAPDRFRSTFCAPSMMWLPSARASPYRCTFPVVRLQPHSQQHLPALYAG